MRRRERKPSKERLAIGAAFFDVLNHLVSVIFGRIEIVRQFLQLFAVLAIRRDLEFSVGTADVKMRSTTNKQRKRFFKAASAGAAIFV